MQQALNLVQKKNNPCPPSLHHPEEEEDSPATPTPCAKKDHCRRTPETLTKLGKNTAACPLLKYVADLVRKTKPSSIGQHILSHPSCTQRKWALDKENLCLMSSIEPSLTPNPGNLASQWAKHSEKEGKWKGILQGQLTWSNLFISLDRRLTIWPVVVFPMAELLRRSDWNERNIQRIGFLQWYQVVWEHSKKECIFTGSCVVSGWAEWCLKSGL